MKKTIFILSILFLPFITHAQVITSKITSKKAISSDQIIQYAADELKPALCQNDLKEAIKIVNACYYNIPMSYKGKVNQCITEDFMVSSLAKMKRSKAK